MAALGLKGLESAGAGGAQLFGAALRKNFRAALRTGGRRAAQLQLERFAGRQVARILSERSVLRIVPVANAFIGAAFNNRITKNVGTWAHIRAKTRSATLKPLKELAAIDRNAQLAALAILSAFGTLKDQATDNFMALYRFAAREVDPTEDEIATIEASVDTTDCWASVTLELSRHAGEEVTRKLYDIATSAAAVNLKSNDDIQEHLKQCAMALGQPFDPNHASDRIRYFKE